MDGKGKQQPAGSRPGGVPRRPSPAVYRRRRLVAGILVLAVLVGLGFAVAAGVRALSGGKETASAESTVPVPMLTTPAAGPAASAPAEGKDAGAPTEKPSATTLCPAGSVKVLASTDAEVYPAGATPVLTLTVTNTGESDCEINVGTSQMEFLVTSGSDRIFSSVDCQDGAQDLVKKVKAGASETANFPWNRNRSAPGCAAVASNPNPGYYIFTARLGESSSEKAVFQLE